MIGIKINQKIENTEIVKKLIKNQLLTIPAGENVIRILPPLIITEQHVSEAISKIEMTIKEFS